MFGKILVPVDGSTEALTAARYARKIAEKFESAVTLLYVIQHTAYLAPNSQQLSSSVLRSLEEGGEQVLEQAVKEYEDFDGRLTRRIEYGHPGIKIVEISKEQNYSLIVMGRRGMSDVAKLLLGSVSNYVLHYALCPTLIIRNQGDSNHE